MTDILLFPQKLIKIPNKYPRQQLFLVGKIYSGPVYDKKVTHYYLRRNTRRNDTSNKVKTWSLKIFKTEKDTNDVKLIEIDSCIENEVIEMLEKWNLFNQLTYKKLHRMGWRGKIKRDAIIVNIKQPN